MAKTSKKIVPVESSAEDAMEYAYSTLEELRDEVREGVENQRDHAGIAATSRFQTMETTADDLDNIVGARNEWCQSIDNETSSAIRCSYTENRKRSASRSDRRDNAVAALDAAIQALNDWADEQDNRDDVADMAEDEKENLAEMVDEARELANALEEHKDTAEGLEFPGMRG